MVINFFSTENFKIHFFLFSGFFTTFPKSFFENPRNVTLTPKMLQRRLNITHKYYRLNDSIL